jgi:hypothetical protein
MTRFIFDGFALNQTQFEEKRSKIFDANEMNIYIQITLVDAKPVANPIMAIIRASSSPSNSCPSSHAGIAGSFAATGAGAGSGVGL